MLSERKITVREAREEDKQHAARIFAESFSGSWRYWSLRLLNVLKLIVAEAEGRVVGAAELYVTEVEGYGKVGVVSFIAVDKGFRRQGVGKRLVEAAEKIFAAAGCEYVAASTRNGNKASLTLFRSTGYELHSRGSRVFEELEIPLYAYEDDIVMLKRLHTGTKAK